MNPTDFMRICETVAIATGACLGLDYLMGILITHRPWIWRVVMGVVVALSLVGFFWRVSTLWR